jgi:alpha-amylase/alpha-mannosidase (GH57 family)
MHQPYYKDLLTQEAELPWVRLHGVKDYLDMVQILGQFPKIKQNFNLVPSLLEQIEGYANDTLKDKFLQLSSKPTNELSSSDQQFILDNFFSINIEKVIATHPRYYALYFKRLNKEQFTEQNFLDLQVWFNLAWIDPSFRNEIAELKKLIRKARFFSEEDKQVVLSKQAEILQNIIPVYKKFMQSKQVEFTVTPYYHPILPLLYNTNIAKEANSKTILPKVKFSYPQDAETQINLAVDYFKAKFGSAPVGMWPSEQAISEHILPYIIKSGIKWIVLDEAILFKSLRRKKRDTNLLYQPHFIKREEGELSIVFRDRNLSDLIGFVYHKWTAENAVSDFIRHLEEIASSFKDRDILVTIAMDGENAWEYYSNDGHDFLQLLYQRLSESKMIQTTTVSEYLNLKPTALKIDRLAAGSWIFGEFGKWIGNPKKAKAWEYLAKARQELEEIRTGINSSSANINFELAWKQMYILEGSDWFWWFGEDPDGSFDRLFRRHLTNFYNIIGKEAPEYTTRPL